MILLYTEISGESKEEFVVKLIEGAFPHRR